MTAITRLAMARALLDSRLKIESITDKLSPKIYEHKFKIVALRDRLLGRSSGGISNLNVFAPEIATADLIEYMGTLANASPADKAIASEYLRQINRQLQQSSASQGLEVSREVSNLSVELGLDATWGDYAIDVEVLNSFTRKGRDDAYELHEAAIEAARFEETVQARFKYFRNQYTEKRAEIYKKIYAESDIAHEKWWDFVKEMYAKGVPESALTNNDEYLRLYREWMEAKEKATNYDYTTDELAKFRKFTPDDDSLKELEKDRKTVQEGFKNLGNALISKVIALSPITEKAAQEWANNVPIEKAAKAKLEKMGYTVKRLQADMAEFYRLTHGRMGNVGISTTRGQRANASNIVSEVAGSVNVPSHFDKRALFHELAHHLEADPAARMASNGFLLSRRTTERVKSLRSLTGNKGYKSHEVAYEDHFIDPYVGRYYSHGISEVFSMGMESFSDPEMLARRAAADPQHIALMLGFVRSDIHPAYRAVQGIYESKVNAASEYKEATESTRDELITEIIKTITIDKTAPESPYLAIDSWMRSMYRIKKYIGKINIGKMNDYYVYSCQSRNYSTRRLVADIILVWKDENGRWNHDLVNSADVNTAKAKAFALHKNIGPSLGINELQKLTEIIQNDTP
jgi:hypothetical protein